MAKKRTNPNGANQYQMDPRQKLCWDYYINPKSETFSNATQSAIKAGYEPDYADQITTKDWFVGKIRKLNLLEKAERNLDKILDLPLDRKANIVLDASKFIAKTLGKDEGYSERSEITGKDGENLVIQISEVIANKNGINPNTKPNSG